MQISKQGFCDNIFSHLYSNYVSKFNKRSKFNIIMKCFVAISCQMSYTLKVYVNCYVIMIIKLLKLRTDCLLKLCTRIINGEEGK